MLLMLMPEINASLKERDGHNWLRQSRPAPGFGDGAASSQTHDHLKGLDSQTKSTVPLGTRNEGAEWILAIHTLCYNETFQ